MFVISHDLKLIRSGVKCNNNNYLFETDICFPLYSIFIFHASDNKTNAYNFFISLYQET